MKSPIRTYGFINAKLRARISMLLDEEKIQQLVQARSLIEALGLLRTTPYEMIDVVYRKTGDLKLGELEFFKIEVGIYEEITRYTEGVLLRVVQALLLRYEIDILKNAVRLFYDRNIRHRSIEAAWYYVYREKILHDFSIDEIIGANSIERITEALKKSPYSAIIEENWENVEKTRSLFSLEIAFDRFYYQNLLNETACLSQTDRRVVERLVGVEIDLQNIYWITRYTAYYEVSSDRLHELIVPGGHNLSAPAIEEALHAENMTHFLQSLLRGNYPDISMLLSSNTHGSTSRLLLIERLLEKIMIHEVRKTLAGFPFSIGIILSYYILKRNEIRKIQTILNAKQYDLSPDRIKGAMS